MPQRTQIGLLCAMIAAACLVQIVAIGRAAVPALDAVRFADLARAIDQSGLGALVQTGTDPPLFPLVVWGIHRALTAVAGDVRESWAISVQVAAALPLVVIPIPVFLLGKRVAGASAAMQGTVLLVCLPELVRLGADGISDSTCLLGVSLALALLVAHLQSSEDLTVPWFPVFLAGLATAMATLARSEAVLLAGALGLVLLVRAIRRRQVPWRPAVCYCAGFLAILGPCLLARAIGPGARDTASADPGGQLVLASPAGAERVAEEQLSFAPKDPTISIRRRGMGAALAQLAEELPKAFGYLPGVFALTGLWILRRRPVSDGERMLVAFGILLLGAIVFHTAREGYLSARHLLPLAVAATPCLGVGLDAAAGALCRALGRGGNWQKSHQAAAMALVVGALCTCYAIRPLHQSRLGHRCAAGWLARNADSGDRVVDTQGWTGLYSGLTTVPYSRSGPEWLRPDLRYLVVEDQELARDSSRSRTLQRLVERAGTLVAAFPSPPASSRAPPVVLVYRWNADCPGSLP